MGAVWRGGEGRLRSPRRSSFLCRRSSCSYGWQESLLQDSIVLYVVALVIGLYWFRVCETLLVRFGLLRMEGVEVK